MLTRPIEHRLIDRVLKLRASEHWHSPLKFPFDFHASECGEKCLRRLYFKRKMPPDWRERDETLLLYETGNVFHRDIQDLFPKKDVEVEVEVPFKDFRILGRVDIVHDGDIWELKTTSRMPTKPYERHECQVEVYMRALKKKEASVIYIKKADYSILSFQVFRDSIRWDEIKLRIRRVVQALQDGTVPDATYSYGCRYCSFYSNCKKMRLF